jgi:hypothetical protein
MNAIPEKEMKEIIVIAMSKDSMKLLCEVPIKDKTLTELDVSGNGATLTELDENGTKMIASGKSLGTEGALVVAEYLRDNGALSKLIFGGDKYRAQRGLLLKWVYPEPATLEVGMTEANFGSKELGAGGAIIISAWLTHKDKGAMTSLNLASNCLCGLDEDCLSDSYDASGTLCALSCPT